MTDKYYRLVTILVNICPGPLRELFLKHAKTDPKSKAPYTTLDAYLLSRQKDIMKLMSKKVLRQHQYDLLFPLSPAQADIKTWDLTLLTLMLTDIFKRELQSTDLTFVNTIRVIRNDLQHISGTCQITNSEFDNIYKLLLSSTIQLASSAKGQGYSDKIKTDIENAAVCVLTDLGDLLRQWYLAETTELKDNIRDLQEEIGQLKDEIKEIKEVATQTRQTLKKTTVKRPMRGGKISKRFKTEDHILDNMRGSFQALMKHELNTDFQSPPESTRIAKELEETHLVVVSGYGKCLYQQTALSVIDNLDYAEDRCVAVSCPSDWRHIGTEDVDLVVFLYPFGKTTFDKDKARSMNSIFDHICESTKISTEDDTEEFIDVMIITDQSILDECKKHFNHDVIENPVIVYKPTTEDSPVDLEEHTMADKYYRLVSFLVNICPQTLRELFIKYMKADPTRLPTCTTLQGYLASRKPQLQILRRRKVIRQYQWNLLFPKNGQVDESSWDTTLVILLIDELFQVQLQKIEEGAINDIRGIRNRLQQMADTTVTDVDFDNMWTILETATLDIARQIQPSPMYEHTIKEHIDDTKINNMPKLGDTLRHWYENTIFKLQCDLEDMKEVMHEMSGTTADNLKITTDCKTILQGNVVTKDDSSVKRMKTVDHILVNMNHTFKTTMKDVFKSGFQSPKEIADIKKKLRDIHHVVVTGIRGSRYLETALTAIQDFGYNLNRCVEMRSSSDWRHIDPEEVDLVLCREPFGDFSFDENRAKSMVDIFDSIYKTAKPTDGSKSVAIVIVSDLDLLQKVSNTNEHDLLEEVVHVYQHTSVNYPEDLTVPCRDGEASATLKNLLDFSAIFMERHTINLHSKIVFDRAKAKLKTNKVIIITGPRKSGKTSLAIRLSSAYQPHQILILRKPEDMKFVNLIHICIIIIDDFAGKYRFEKDRACAWLEEFEILSSIVSAGKLNVIVTCEETLLQKCYDEFSKHPFLENQITLKREDIVVKREIDRAEISSGDEDALRNEVMVSDDALNNAGSSSEDFTGIESKWKSSIETKDEGKAYQLLENGQLPDGALLDKACQTFGLKSSLLKDICTQIEQKITASSDCIIYSNACYKETDTGKIVFCIITRLASDYLDLSNFKEKYNVLIRSLDYCSKEGKIVIDNERGLRFDDSEMQALEVVLRENSPDLMKNHSNLTLTTGSKFKSHTEGAKDISNKVCIVFYVTIKGLIPVGENLLPKKLGQFDTDVREGRFSFAVDGQPGAIHNNLKIGCRISCKEGAGTIGGFVQHPKHGICAITCAHVVLSKEEILGIRKKKNENPGIGKECFQPDYNENGENKCGQVIEVRMKEDSNNSGGVDAALIKIYDDRIPTSGDFPDCALSDIKGGCSHCKESLFREIPSFKNGRVLKNTSEINTNNNVVKYGQKTKFTIGMLKVKGGSVRFEHCWDMNKLKGTNSSKKRYQFTMHNLLEINSLGPRFAEAGDSGALVFSQDVNNTLAAFGLLVGYDSATGITLVQPICSVLEHVGLHRPFTFINFDPHERRLDQLEKNVAEIQTNIQKISDKLGVV